MVHKNPLVFTALTAAALVTSTCAHQRRAVTPAPAAAPSAASAPSVAAPLVTCPTCQVQLNSQAASSFGAVRGQQPGGCSTHLSHGFPLPDPNCTPGAENPTVTLQVLKNPGFRTSCLRNCVTTELAKHVTYSWYGLTAPANNTGATETCELDHLVPLELGGADTLDNIWPQCGPAGVSLNGRYFKEKDLVENYLAAQVKAGSMDLEQSRRKIASDWTPFLRAAKAYCATHTCQ